MTDLVPVGAGAFGIEGLEDFDESDLIMPTLKLGANQDAGFIIDGLSGERYPGEPGIEMVVLGIVKQRILWPPEMGPTKEDPLCKSYEFKLGHPDPENPSRYPWAASGFTAPAVGAPPSILSCEDCRLKEWGTNPGPQKEAPWCTEQHTYVVLQIINESYAPAILMLQRTGIKPSKAYMSSFARTKTPMFIKTTHLRLSVQKRGIVEYSVPILEPGRPTPPEMFQQFADQYRRIRTMLQTPRSGDIEDVPVAAPASNVHQPAPAPVAQPAPAPVAQPAPAPAPQPAPVAAPAPAPVAAPAPAPVAAPAPAPVAAPIEVTATDVAPAAPAPAPIAPAPVPQAEVPVAPVVAPADVAPPAAPAPVATPVPQAEVPAVPAPVAAPVAQPAAPAPDLAPAAPVAQPVATNPDDDLPF